MIYQGFCAHGQIAIKNDTKNNKNSWHKMQYHTEFKLTSCKWIFRHEDLKPDEEKYWLHHLNQDGFVPENPRAIFKPFYGEESIYNNEDYATDELRVRRWNWLGNELVDINAWPGDNESGVITIDGEIFINNGDANLYLVDDDKDYGFKDRLEFFSELRGALTRDEDMIDFDVVGIEEFRASDQGKASIEIETNAFDKYRVAHKAITDEHFRLQNLYLCEFILLRTQPQPQRHDQWSRLERFNPADKFKIAEEIGYNCQKTCFGNYDENTQFKFIQWNPTGSDKSYILVSIYENYHFDTYLLDEQGKIGPKVYEGNYNVLTSEDRYAEIIKALRPRIYSFITTHNQW